MSELKSKAGAKEGDGTSEGTCSTMMLGKNNVHLVFVSLPSAVSCSLALVRLSGLGLGSQTVGVRLSCRRSKSIRINIMNSRVNVWETFGNNMPKL